MRLHGFWLPVQAQVRTTGAPNEVWSFGEEVCALWRTNTCSGRTSWSPPVYLPAGADWTDTRSGERFAGGRAVPRRTPLGLRVVHPGRHPAGR